MLLQGTSSLPLLKIPPGCAALHLASSTLLFPHVGSVVVAVVVVVVVVSAMVVAEALVDAFLVVAAPFLVVVVHTLHIFGQRYRTFWTTEATLVSGSHMDAAKMLPHSRSSTQYGVVETTGSVALASAVMIVVVVVVVEVVVVVVVEVAVVVVVVVVVVLVEVGSLQQST